MKRDRRLALTALGAAVALLGATSAVSAHEPQHAPGGECLPGSQDPIAPYERFNRGTDAPLLITEDCVDPRYNTPIIDAVTVGTTAPPTITEFILVHGRFADSTPGPGLETTPATFAYYFPLQGYEGRFYVGAVHQLRLTGELAAVDVPEAVRDLSPFGVFLGTNEVDHAAASGAYLVEYSPYQDYALAARDAIGAFGYPDSQYRVAAAAAKYSRVLAQAIYGYEHRPYGYIYGGSGGAYISITNAEHTIGVWDGVLPFVMGHPLAIPGDFTVRLHALRVLRKRNKWPEVMDAIDPGGSGNPYLTLNEVEAGALQEATLLGFPQRGWHQHAGLAGGPFFLVAAYAPIMDPTYADDFWTLPGYLGTEASATGDDVRAARVEHSTSVIAATPPVPVPDYNLLGPTYNLFMLSQYVSGPVRAVTLESLPAGIHDYTNDFHLYMVTGAAAGKRVKIGMVETTTNTIIFGGGEDPAVVNMISIGDQVRVENSLYLALQTHHRHQVPYDDDVFGGIPAGSALYGWDQFRNPDSTPKYPQRPAPLVGPVGNYNSAGSVSTGHFHDSTKVLVAQSVMDIDAFAWCADWYRTVVKADKEAQGQSLDDHFRLYYTDHAEHTGGGGTSTRTVSYRGVLEQGLRDLEAWAEQGVPPPGSSSYDVVDNAIALKPTAADRKGIQPVPELMVSCGAATACVNEANGKRVDVAVGQSVTFTANIETPPGAGKVVSAEWDFDGEGPGEWTDAAAPVQETVALQVTQSYATPGTYFPAIRATSQREGDPATPYARIDNIDRVRVVVVPEPGFTAVWAAGAALVALLRRARCRATDPD